MAAAPAPPWPGLTAADLQAYARDGFVIARGLLSGAEAATLIMDLGEGRLLLPSHYIMRNAPAGANGRAGEESLLSLCPSPLLVSPHTPCGPLLLTGPCCRLRFLYYF